MYNIQMNKTLRNCLIQLSIYKLRALRLVYFCKDYVLYRFIHQTHIMKSSLTKGKWYDFGDKLLFCAFDELVIYVEQFGGSVASNILTRDIVGKNFNFFRKAGKIPQTNPPGFGIYQLRWLSDIGKSRPSLLIKKQPPIPYPLSQAQVAQEILILYHWWKYVRPNRQEIDPSVDLDIVIKYELEDREMLHRLVDQRSNLWA
jgi:hypothetical protein